MELRKGDVLLRPIKMEDAKAVVQMANNEKVSANMRDTFPFPYRLKDAKTFIRNFLKQDVFMVFAIFYKGIYTGNIGVFPGADVYRFGAEIGYFLGEPYWNKGIMSVALELATEYAFREMGIIRLHAGVYEYNTASMKVLEKCAYQKEGIARKAVFKNGNFRDEHRYALVKPSYVDIPDTHFDKY